MNEHIVIHKGTMELECRICREKYKPRLPCPVDLWLAMAEEFINLHKGCADRKEEAV